MEEHETHQGEDHHKESKKSDSIAIDKLTIWQVISGILVILLVISIYTGGFGGSKSKVQGITQEAQPTQPTAPSLDMKSLVDDDAVKGDKNAPVTIVEWSDFECPYCARFYQQTFGQIEKEYIETGKVKFIYRDFPLGFHVNAQKAAEAAECAGEQGKFWEMHDKLFEQGVSGGIDSFKQFAKDIGLDASKFNECIDSGKMASEIAKDTQDGQAAGITGTPGFVINGKLVVGAQPFENFKQIIDEGLAK
ncbi:MAG: DsbA family protein [archaeon]